MGVIRTLLDRCDGIVTEDEERKDEKETIKDALRMCGSPDWTMRSVAEKMGNKSTKEEGKTNKGTIVLPYVKCLLEKVAMIFKKRGVYTYHSPVTTS